MEQVDAGVDGREISADTNGQSLCAMMLSRNLTIVI